MKRKLQLAAILLTLGAILAGTAVAASSPGVVTDSAIRVGLSTAVLRGAVNPNGAPTSYQFQFGLTTAYGLTSAAGLAGGGGKPIQVRESATGLIPGTVYHYRLAALSRYGTSLGADRTFKTAGHPPPGVVTGPATGLGASAATLTGAVNPNGATTRWLFEYGLTTSYGLQTMVGTVPAGAPMTVSATVQGLASGTTFHFRLVGLHGASAFAVGSDQTFVTYPSPRPRTRVLASTRPRRARHKPYVLTTSATIGTPRALPQSVACGDGGTVGIRYFLGRRQIAFRLTPLQPNCRLSSRVVLRHPFWHGRRHRAQRVRIVLHFRGNHYLAPSNARPEHVTIG